MTKSKGIYRPRRKWSEEMLVQILEERFPTWKLTSPFIKAKENVELTCRCCGHKSTLRPFDIDLNFTGHCKNCLRLQKGKEFYLGLLKDGHFPQFKPEDYVNNHTEMKFICKNGAESTTSYNDYFAKNRPKRVCSCEKCKTRPERKLRSKEEALEDLYQKGFIVTGEYKNTYTKVVGVWRECLHFDYLKPTCILIGKSRCEQCRTAERRSEEVKRGKAVS